MKGRDQRPRPSLFKLAAITGFCIWSLGQIPDLPLDPQTQQGVHLGALFLSGLGFFRIVQELSRRGEAMVGHIRAFRGEDKGGTELLNAKEASKAGIDTRARHSRFLGALEDVCLWANPETHHLVIGPAGSQKSSSVIMNILCSNDTSTLVNDTKRELYETTSRIRRAMGHDVYIIDPDDPKSACVNPLDMIVAFLEQNSPETLTYSIEMALQLYPEPPQEGQNKYFRDGTRLILQALIILVCIVAKPKERNLASVFRALSSEDYLEDLLVAGMASDKLNGEVAAMAHDLEQKAFGDAKSTNAFENFRIGALQALAPFGPGGLLQRITSKSTFSFDVLKTGKATVYLSINPTKSKALAQLPGLMQFVAIHQIVRHNNNKPVVFCLDEFCNAPLYSLPNVLTLLRSYGVRAIMATQDLEDIDRVYGKHDRGRILSEAAVKQFLAGIRSQTTLDYLSKHMGEIDDVQVSFGLDPDGKPRESISSIRRPLMSADQIRRLESHLQIILIENLKPIIARKVQVFAIASWRRRIGINRSYGKRRYLLPVEVCIFGPWWLNWHWVTARGRTRRPMRRSTKRIIAYVLKSLLPSGGLVVLLILALAVSQVGMPYVRWHYTFSGSFAGTQNFGSCSYFGPKPFTIYENRCPLIVFRKGW